MKTSKVRQLVAGTAVTVVLAAAGIGTALALDSEESGPKPQPPVVDGPVTDAAPNPYAANDCAVLLDVFGEGAQAYGCIERPGPAGPPSELRTSARTVGAADVGALWQLLSTPGWVDRDNVMAGLAPAVLADLGHLAEIVAASAGWH